MHLSQGLQIDDFIIEEAIGRGGSATVYAARQRSVPRRVALKVIECDPDEEQEFLKRFTREAQVIAALEHMHILPIYAYGVLEGEIAYFAMRLLPHGTLDDALRKKGALSLNDAVDLFTQIASGLAYMHLKGVIHRDLKPSNVLLDEEGNAYLSDFGLARFTNATKQLSEHGLNVVGSPHYLAPELIEGETADPLSDIYSLGVLLYQMLCGRLPFEAGDGGVSAILYKHVREKPPSPRQFNPDIPADVEAVVMRALSKNPEEMAYELTVAALRTPGRFSRTPKFASDMLKQALKPNRKYLVALIGLVSLLVVIAAGALVLHNRSITPMNVEIGAYGTLDSERISDGELGAARNQLSGGFIADFPCTVANAFQASVTRSLSDLAAQNQLPMRIYDSGESVATQLALIEQARAEGAKAFIICPLDSRSYDAPIRSLREANIPLVLAWRYTAPEGYGIQVSFDDERIGREQGRYAGELLQAQGRGSGAVVALSFTEVLSGQIRVQGIAEGLRQTAPGATLIGPLNVYTREQAQQAIQGLIEQGTHFDAVVAFTDAAALGAIDAAKAAGLTPEDVFTVSANGEQPLQSYIQNGNYARGSVRIDYEELSELLLTGIVKALSGSPVPQYLTVSSGDMITAQTPSS
jgi:ABC-type sugar transport system substrate-binding protein